ncbi:MAG: hypothetical protein ACYCS1_04365 [Gammaproteobacteria bacterium]
MNNKLPLILLVLSLSIIILFKSVNATQVCSFVDTIPQINGTFNQATFQCDYNTIITEPSCITNTSINPTPYFSSAFSSCYQNIGNNSFNPNNISTPPNCSIYCANMVIYLNPAGFFEYALDNGTNLFNNNPSIYENVPPDYSVYSMYNDYLNVTSLAMLYLNPSSVSSITSSPVALGMKNFTYEGSIFYSGLVNIYPLEQEANQGNLTISEFLMFVQENQVDFYNTTIILQTPFLQVSGAAITSSIITSLEQSVIPLVFLPTTITNPQGASQQVTDILSNNVAYINTTSVTVPLVASYYPNDNGYIKVSYNYEGQFLGDNYQTFNQYFDQYYAPQLVTYYFITNTAPLLLLITVLLFIISKLNGE